MQELTKQKALDMNEIVSTALDTKNRHSESFEIVWYNAKIRKDLDREYLFHLHSLMIYYNKKYNREWLTFGDRGLITPNFNTGHFLSEGGYLKILELENQEERIKDLTEKQLQKSIWQIKGWWIFILINAVISFLIAWFSKTASH